MNKLSAIALLASGAAANLKIDLYNPMNLLKYNNGPVNTIQSLIKAAQTPSVGGSVTYAQCDDDAGSFTLDKKSTTNKPDPLVKGQDVTLMLRGLVDEGIDFNNVHVHVDWNGSTLYDEDHPMTNHYDTTYSYDVSWSVPSYAPSGHYAVTITGQGKTDEVSGKVMCVSANFDL